MFNFERVRQTSAYYGYSPFGRILKSYDSLIAIDTFGRTIIDERYYKYSATTSKHLGEFLGLSSKEIALAIKNGDIELMSHQDFMDLCYA